MQVHHSPRGTRCHYFAVGLIVVCAPSTLALGPPAGRVGKGIEAAKPVAAAREDDWRRTSRGWERAVCWEATRRLAAGVPPMTGVHPLVLAALQLLISLTALAAFGARQRLVRGKNSNILVDRCTENRRSGH